MKSCKTCRHRYSGTSGTHVCLQSGVMVPVDIGFLCHEWEREITCSGIVKESIKDSIKLLEQVGNIKNNDKEPLETVIKIMAVLLKDQISRIVENEDQTEEELNSTIDHKALKKMQTERILLDHISRKSLIPHDKIREVLGW